MDVRNLIWASHQGLGLYLLPGDENVRDIVRLQMSGMDSDRQTWNWGVNLGSSERQEIQVAIEQWGTMTSSTKWRLSPSVGEIFRVVAFRKEGYLFVRAIRSVIDDPQFAIFWRYQNGAERGVNLSLPDAEGLWDGMQDFVDRAKTEFAERSLNHDQLG